jgi:hypothetical protein
MTSRISTALVAAFLILLGACKDGTGPAPTPEVTAVSPASAQWGATGVTLAVTGTGFRRESVVRWDQTPLTTTYVSGRELRAEVPDELLKTGGVHAVTVATPAPGGGTSAAQNVTVNFPAPVLSSLSVDSSSLDRQGVTVIATGTGFTPETRVVWNGQELATTWRSGTEVSFSPVMSAAGVFQVAVRNPSPGGGTSAGRSFSVLNPVPVITLLPSYGATAGRPGFTMMLHGTGFLPSSTVRVNGQARGANFVSATRLEVPVSSAELAAPGTLAFSVVNGGPVERVGNTATLTVRTLGAPAPVVQRLPLNPNDVVWHAGTGRLYLSIPSSGGALGNTVAALDPTTGTITGSVFVGSEPGRMAISGDGQFLYVGLNGTGAVRRVDLATLTAGLQWSIGGGHVAGDLAVVPGQPRNVVVSIHSPGYSPPLEGVQLYEDGVARGTASPGHTGGARIEFLGSPSTLYGYNNSHTGFEFFTMSVDAGGVKHVNETRGLVNGFYTDIVGASGRIYGYDGSVVDAERRTRIGSLGVNSFGLAADPATGRVFMISSGGIHVRDMNTFQELGVIPVADFNLPHPAAFGSPLVRWGTNGLAFLDENELFIIRSPLVAP